MQLHIDSKPKESIADRRRATEALYATGHFLLEGDRPAHASGVFRAMALLAPTDERAWLGLGSCHEALGQSLMALEMYGTGGVLAPHPVRLEVARARLLRTLGRGDEGDEALARAAEHAEQSGEPALVALVSEEARS